jgi:hypothetical protein
MRLTIRYPKRASWLGYLAKSNWLTRLTTLRSRCFCFHTYCCLFTSPTQNMLELGEFHNSKAIYYATRLHYQFKGLLSFESNDIVTEIQ